MLLLNVVNIHAGCESGKEMKESDAVSKKVSEKIPGISW